MFSNVMLAKITDYADSLMSGHIYMNNLTHFRDYEEKNLNEKYGVQTDYFDGMKGVIVGTPNEICYYLQNNFGKNESDAQYVVKQLCKYHDETKNSLERHGTEIKGEGNRYLIFDTPDNVKVFCMYMFHYNDVEKTYIQPDSRLIDFGKDVVMFSPQEFFDVVIPEISKHGIVRCAIVQYDERHILSGFNNQAGIYYLGESHKHSSFAWQYEFRIICEEYNPTDEPLIVKVDGLDINCINLTGIAKRISTKEFIAPSSTLLAGYKPTHP